MDIKKFMADFNLAPAMQIPGRLRLQPTLLTVDGYGEFASRFAGCTFENGLYRVHDDRSGPRAAKWIAEYFPDFSGVTSPFSYTWTGDQIAVDKSRERNGQPLLALIEIGTGSVLELPFTFTEFHENLAEEQKGALLSEMFTVWAQANPGCLPLRSSDCVGYRVPLFLGGGKEVDDLEVTDMEIYWAISGQLRLATIDLPEGTPIAKIDLELQYGADHLLPGLLCGEFAVHQIRDQPGRAQLGQRAPPRPRLAKLQAEPACQGPDQFRAAPLATAGQDSL